MLSSLTPHPLPLGEGISYVFPFQFSSSSVKIPPLMDTEAVIRRLSEKYRRPIPDVRPGYTVRVHQKVVEGGKERLQVFEGLVLSIHRGRTATDGSFTVRKVVEGIGVERVYPLCSPVIAKVEVVKVAPVRRAKLTFLRSRSGKAAKLSERFTKADEFAVAVAAPVASAEVKQEEGESKAQEEAGSKN